MPRCAAAPVPHTSGLFAIMPSWQVLRDNRRWLMSPMADLRPYWATGALRIVRSDSNSKHRRVS